MYNLGIPTNDSLHVKMNILSHEFLRLRKLYSANLFNFNCLKYIHINAIVLRAYGRLRVDQNYQDTLITL